MDSGSLNYVDPQEKTWEARTLYAERELDALKAAVKAGTATDGYHTHNELYDYRRLYHAHAARGWLAQGIPVVKSWRHSDGELCFGGGWFIVSAQLPTGQVTNHYEAEHWDLFAVPEVETPPTYDGHTPAEVAVRLEAMLMDLCVRYNSYRGCAIILRPNEDYQEVYDLLESDDYPTYAPSTEGVKKLTDDLFFLGSAKAKACATELLQSILDRGPKLPTKGATVLRLSLLAAETMRESVANQLARESAK